jgi:hypothetical protein
MPCQKRISLLPLHLVEALERVCVLGDELLHDGAHRLHVVHRADDLADEVVGELGGAGGFVGGSRDARLGLADEARLQRHRQRLRVRGIFPGVGPGAAELARGLARQRATANGVRGARLQEFLLDDGMGLGLLRRQPERTEPDALGAQREGSGDLASVADAPGGEHGDRRDGVDDLGDEHHRRNLAGMSARFVALGDDEVGAGGGMALGMFDGAGQRRDLDALGAPLLDHPGGRRAEGARDQLDRMLEEHLDDLALFVETDEELAAQLGVRRERRDVVAGEEVFEEAAVFRGDSRVELARVEAAGLIAPDELGREQ